MKYVHKILLALLAAVMCACALAQTASTTIVVSWTAPTKNTDGTTITGTLTYQAYQGTPGGAFVAVGGPVSALTETVTSVAAGNCFTVVAIETSGTTVTDSVPSNTVCAEVPNPAGTVTLTWTETVH